MAFMIPVCKNGLGGRVAGSCLGVTETCVPDTVNIETSGAQRPATVLQAPPLGGHSQLAAAVVFISAPV